LSRSGAILAISGGVLGTLRARPVAFVGGTLAILALSLLAPPVLLSLVRKPVDYFTVNPWLRRLPAYLASPEIPLREKLEKVPELALFWFSADSPFGGTEWGFAVDVGDLARMLATSLLLGACFAFWRDGRRGTGAGARALGRRGGLVGAVLGVVGLSTGPCSVMGCGAPVLPVVGLAFVGLSSGTLAVLSSVSKAASWLVLLGTTAVVGYLGWRAGSRGTSARPRR
jgi:hypothetical protein